MIARSPRMGDPAHPRRVHGLNSMRQGLVRKIARGDSGESIPIEV